MTLLRAYWSRLWPLPVMAFVTFVAIALAVNDGRSLTDTQIRRMVLAFAVGMTVFAGLAYLYMWFRHHRPWATCYIWYAGLGVASGMSVFALDPSYRGYNLVIPWLALLLAYGLLLVVAYKRDGRHRWEAVEATISVWNETRGGQA